MASQNKKIKKQELLISNLSKEYSDINKKYLAEQKILDDKSSTFDNLTTTKNKLTTRINALNAEIANNKKEIVQLDINIKKLTPTIPQIENSLVVEGPRLTEYKSVQETQKRIWDDSSLKVDQQNSIVQNILNQIANNNSRRNQLISERSSNINFQNNNEGTIQRNERQIQTNTKSIADSETEIVRNGYKIDSLETELSTSQNSLSRASSNYQNADSNASYLEQQSDYDYSQYQKREGLYNSFNDEAKQLGANQGERDATSVGDKDGEELGLIEGKSNGLRIGEEIGLLDGFYRGLMKGKIQGDFDGYDVGLNSKYDYDTGFKQGKIMGREKAYIFAKENHYPVAYKEQEAQNLTSIPDGETITLDNQLKNAGDDNFRGIMQIDRDFEIVDQNSEVFTDYVARWKDQNLKYIWEASKVDYNLSAEEKRTSDQIKSSIDQEIFKTIRTSESYLSPERSLSTSQTAYTAPGSISVNMLLANCSNVYKGVQDFIKSCKSSYDSSYRKEYLNSHRSGYAAVYPEQYNEHRASSFSKYKDSHFPAGYEKSYKVVFLEARERGAQKINDRGIQDGIRFGYDKHLDEAIKQAIIVGQDDADKFQDENPVVRFRKQIYDGVSLVAANQIGLIQGGKFKLALNLANFGQKPTLPGQVVVSWKPISDNIKLMGATSINLLSLPADKKIDIENTLYGKILSNALPGSEIKLEVTLTTPGDMVSALNTEKRIVSAVVTPNPEVKIEVAYDKNPKAHEWKFWPFTKKDSTHEIKVKLTGIHPNVPNGYRVVLSLIEGDEIIKIDNNSFKTSTINLNQTVQDAFSYHLKKKTSGKQVSFAVTVFYDEHPVVERRFSARVD